MTHTKNMRIARFNPAKPVGKRWNFSYYKSGTFTDGKAVTGYLDSDFYPCGGKRWAWCDDVTEANIRHTGWYTDEHGMGDKMRGVVAMLPHGRFIAGWSMGIGMASVLHTDQVYTECREAALAADFIAEQAAERERDYQEQYDQEQRAEEEAQEEAERQARLNHYPICQHCGSDDICADATARWNIEAQEWTVCTTHDDFTCQSCGKESSEVYYFDEQEAQEEVTS